MGMCCACGYINDDGNTGNIQLAITINKAQGQLLEKCGINLITNCFFMDNYMLHIQKSVNLTIYLYVQTVGQRRMLYIRNFTLLKTYINLSIFTGGTQGHNYNGVQLIWRVRS